MNQRKVTGEALSIRTTSSTVSSPTPSLAEPEIKDTNMAMAEYQPVAPPLTVTIPKNIPSPSNRRPNLSEILANTAPPPWTLSSFMAFLSQNHCLENLEFTMDASRYRKHYSKMVNRHPGSPISPLSDECTYVLMLWRRLIDAYIRESGPREVNLPADVRDTLLNLTDSYVPPHPSSLDEAVSKIYELMEESVLVSFLNSVCPQSAYPTTTSHDSYDSSMSRSQTSSYDERTIHHTRSNPPHLSNQRASAPSSLASNFMHPRPFSHSRFNSQPATSTSSSTSVRMTPSYSGSDALTDDSSTGSPRGMSDPLTPPGTPPMSDYPMSDYHQAYYESGGTSSGTPSPRASRGEHNGLANATRDSWKRVSSKLWPRKRSGGQLREEEQGAVEGGLF